VDDVIQHQDKFYILATSSLLRERRHVLKDGDSFAVFDLQGDVAPFGAGEQGYFHGGTRHLSLLRQTINGQRPLLLSSRVRQQNDLFGADLTNPDRVHDGVVLFPRDVLHIYRSRFLWEGHWHERLRIVNYGGAATTATLMVEFGADYADIFEVRGLRRERRGRLLPASVDREAVRLAYEGLDGALRATVLAFDPAPTMMTGEQATFHLELPPHQVHTLTLTIRCEGPEGQGPARTYDEACEEAAGSGARRRRDWCTLFTANEQFNEWCNRSAADIQMMTSDMPTGPYVYAGVPWFSTPFGRDGIITALEALWANPDLARGTLAYLANTQATAVSEEQDAEPGKILHETRSGEMARLGEVPFGRYYGSVDSTPLFVILAGRYYARTGDRDFIAGLWEHVDRALRWIDDYGDLDGDGFIEYARRNPTGLVHQGWKDSSDSVSHEDGTLADGPIALCEVQGYVFEAKRQGARLAGLLGFHDRARALAGQAKELRERFERAFWSDALGTYVLALGDEASVWRACLERRPLPLQRHRPPRPRTSGGGNADGGCVLHRVGRPDTGDRRAPLQPDVLSQRLDLAPRQRHPRRRPRAVRDARAGRTHSRRAVRCQPVCRLPHAGAFLRIHPSGRRRADAVPGGVLAPGVGGGSGVHAAPGDAWVVDRRRCAANHVQQWLPAGIPAARSSRRAANRKRVGRPCARAAAA
jgi:glycogen debranching enzyme